MCIRVMLLFLLSTAVARAQERRTIDFNFEEPPRGVGVGVVFGDPTGLSLAFRQNERNAVQAHFGFSVRRERFHLNVDYLQNLVILESPEMPGVSFPLYVGVGGRLQLGQGRYYQEPGLGIRIPLGLSILPRTVAIDPFIEVVPLVLLFPVMEAGVEGGAGVRFYF